MFNSSPTIWYHSNRYSADKACNHCKGIIRHEAWCITQDAEVQYAYQIVADGSKLTEGDALFLHSLGVSWGACGCSKKR